MADACGRQLHRLGLARADRLPRCAGRHAVLLLVGAASIVTMQRDGVGRANIDRLECCCRTQSWARTMCGIRMKTISLSLTSLVSSAKRYLNSGIEASPGIPDSDLRLRVLQDSAQDVDFALAHADLVLDFALSDHRLLNAADVLVGVDRRDVHGELQRDFVESMHTGRDVDVHADVNVVELRIDQRIDADAADARLERTGGHRNAFTDFQRSLLTVRCANLRLLDKLATAVAHEEFGGRRRNRHLKVGGVEWARLFRLMLPRGTPVVVVTEPFPVPTFGYGSLVVLTLLSCNRYVTWSGG